MATFKRLTDVYGIAIYVNLDLVQTMFREEDETPGVLPTEYTRLVFSNALSNGEPESCVDVQEMPQAITG